MRLLKKDRSGVSEIIGAIMLVLIVVIAASSFAIFISQYQASAQAKELEDQKRAQEKIKVVSIQPVVSSDNTKWGSLNFTIVSLHSEKSEITRISINDRMVQEFTVWRENPYTFKLEEMKMTVMDQLYIGPREQIFIHVDVDDPTAIYGGASFGVSGYIKIDILTGWSNQFSKNFSPPSSVATHSPGSWFNVSKGQYEYYIALNGRSSVAYDGAYIVSWNWTVESMNETKIELLNASGSVCRVDLPLTAAKNVVTLTVMDNFGMIGRSTITFYN